MQLVKEEFAMKFGKVILYFADVQASLNFYGHFARAVSAGAPPLRQPELPPWGQRPSYLQAPDGTVIDLSSPPPAWG